MRVVVLCALLALATGLAHASDFGDALKAVDRGEFATAFKLWRPLAEKGNALARYNIGVLYHHGLGVERNYREAAKWYRQAAQQGNPVAQYHLGMMYFEGLGVAQDFVRAHVWLNLSGAAQGHPDAVQNRDSAAAQLTAEQILQAQAMARRCEADGYDLCD